jgi:hypothetical protein
MKSLTRHYSILTGATMLATLALPVPGQYLGLNLRGDAGMKSGSQPEPGFYITTPLFYQADYDSLRGPQGNEVPGQFKTEINLLASAVAVTTKWKFLGARYGFQVVPIVLNQRLDVADATVQKSNSYGFGDLYVQPISLGWTTKHADFLGAYGFYAPTGAGHRSLEMWGHELVAGTTVYFDEGQRWHAAGTMFYEIHQTKASKDIRVGDFLTVEGGVGRSFLKGAGSAGVAYILQWKTTDDSGEDILPAQSRLGRNKAYGVGPEITVPFFAKGRFVGLFGFRYTFETGNSTNFKGNNLVASITLAHLRE